MNELIQFVALTVSYFSRLDLKLDGVGPVDNRPSTDKWHVTPDMWHIVEGEHSLKISAS